MPFNLDAQLTTASAAAGGRGRSGPLAPRGDAIALRKIIDMGLQIRDAAEPDSPSVRTADYVVPVKGREILVRWYASEQSAPGSAVVYYHGGGMVCGSVNLFDRFVAKYVQETGVPFLSVDYRLSPEYRGTTLVEDGYAALTWFTTRANDFGVDSMRIAIMGESGGGGVAAGVAIAARDTRIPVAKQFLIYPMLDDRNIEPDPEIEPFAAWTYDDKFNWMERTVG